MSHSNYMESNKATSETKAFKYVKCWHENGRMFNPLSELIGGSQYPSTTNLATRGPRAGASDRMVKGWGHGYQYCVRFHALKTWFLPQAFEYSLPWKHLTCGPKILNILWRSQTSSRHLPGLEISSPTHPLLGVSVATFNHLFAKRIILFVPEPFKKQRKGLAKLVLEENIV